MTQPPMTKESQAFVSSLANQRNHVLGILEGLSEEDLRRPILPSHWTCAGLVHHLAIDVERVWFRAVVAGEPMPDDERITPGRCPRTDGHRGAGRYRRDRPCRCHHRRYFPTAHPAWWPEDLFGSWRLNDLREILLHVIAETATHADHLDAARELIDGRQWTVLTE